MEGGRGVRESREWQSAGTTFEDCLNLDWCASEHPTPRESWEMACHFYRGAENSIA